MKLDPSKFFALVTAIATATACGAPPADDAKSDDRDLIGGSATPDALPTTVRIFGNCTAAKIGERHILIAAHCVDDAHFKQYEQAADVAVIVLTPASAKAIAKVPIATVDPTPTKPGDAVIVTGFGCDNNASSPGGVTGYLKSAETTILSPVEALTGEDVNTRGIDPEKLGTVYNFTEGQARNPNAASLCPGDSGGPVYRKDKRNVIVGVNAYYTFTFKTRGVSWSNWHTRLDGEAPTGTAKWISDLLK